MFSKLLQNPIRQSIRQFSSVSGKASLEGYGRHLFRGAVAAPYLEAQGLAKNTLDDHKWASDEVAADKVAAAVLEWAKDK